MDEQLYKYALFCGLGVVFAWIGNRGARANIPISWVAGIMVVKGLAVGTMLVAADVLVSQLLGFWYSKNELSVGTLVGLPVLYLIAERLVIKSSDYKKPKSFDDLRSFFVSKLVIFPYFVGVGYLALVLVTVLFLITIREPFWPLKLIVGILGGQYIGPGS